MRVLSIIFLLFVFYSCSEKKTNSSDFYLVKDTVINNSKYYAILNSDKEIIQKFNQKKYMITFDDTIKNFIVITADVKKNYGFWAIDLNEQPLFEVYCGGYNKPGPDKLEYGMIRIIDENNKIGFANENGKIVIKPQFEEVSPFYGNYAVFGKNCNYLPENHEREECIHPTLKCKQYGYIDKNGKIIEIGIHSQMELRQMLRFPYDFY